MKKIIFFVCTYFLSSVFSFLAAQTPISLTTWSGSPASAAGPSGFTTLPATVVPGAATVNVSQWNRGAVVVNAAGGCYNSNNWQVGGSLAAAQAGNRCVFFTVTNSATTELHVTRLFIRSQVSATGPQSVQVMYTVGSVTSAFGPTVATTHSASPEDWNLPGNMCIGAGETATFRLYGWGATGSAGTLRINDGTMIVADFATAVTATASSSSPICAGTDLVLTGVASGGVPGYTYSWSGPGSFSSAILTPTITAAPVTAAGVYTLTVTDAMFCTTSSTPVTTTVTVNTSPAPITGTAVVCPLLTTTLSSTSAGGTWTTSDAGIATVGASSGVVTGVAPGTVTITYQLSSTCFTTATVTVNTPPSPITGVLSLCQGLTTTLSSATPGGTWSSGDAAVATTGPAWGVVNGITAGTAAITYTESGCIAVATATVYAFPAAITGTATVCVDATTTLSNPSPGGTWSSQDASIASVGSLTGVVTGHFAGTTRISYTLGSSCSSTIIVTVNALPATIGGTYEVCAGHTQTLTNSSFGGTWSSSNTTVATIGSLTGNVLGGTAGTTTITYRFVSTGCYATAEVTVNAIPLAITGPSVVCVGQSATLNNASAGGTWISSNTAAGTIDNASGSFSGIASGTTIVSYVFTTTGCYVTRTETVNPLPSAITGPTNVCPGLTITLSSSPSGGAWTTSDATVATVGGSTGVVTGMNSGTATITYTLPTTCRATRGVTVDPAPPAFITAMGDTTFCPGDFVVLAANTGIGLSYQWYESAVLLPGATDATYTASATGSYRVRVTNTLACPRMSAPMSVLVNAATAVITVPGGSMVSCASSPVVLNANTGPGLTYQWLLSGTAIPGATGSTWSAGASGDYTVLVINATGCSAESAPVTITINPSPSTAVSTSGPISFCDGGNVVLTAAMGTGYTYQWYNGITVIPGATNASYTATATGNYSVRVTNGFGCSMNSVVTNVTEYTLPNVGISLSGPKVFCTGGSVVLSAVTGPMYSYQWYRAGVAITGATGASYFANTGGGYRVRVTNTVAGCTDMTHADTVVTVVGTPVVMALTPAKFCWGGSSLLSSNITTAGSGAAFQWYLNGGAIAGATGSTYSANDSGNYSYRITVPGSCTLTATAIKVNEVPLPDPIITLSGATLRAQAFYVAYKWYKNLNPIPGGTTYSTPHTGGGSYKVMVTDTNGCQSVSAAYVLNGSVTGIAGTVAGDEIKVYPNPSQGTVFIECRSSLRAVLSSIDGRTLTDTPDAVSVDLSRFADGLYILRLYDQDNILVKAERLSKSSR